MNRKMTAALVLAALTAGAAWGASKAPTKTEKAPRAQSLLDDWVGYRKMALPLPGTQTVFLHKGDRVDVIVTFEAVLKDDTKQKVAATILQNVLLSDVVRPKDISGTGVIEMLVNPNEAQYAALSLAQGTVHVTRRSPKDVEMHPMEIASFRKLFQ
ncbi:MAG: hypothetical protein KGM24_04555 [Elusimicrobia bacterium]|nr:hypothetical protein [Elusimicrobiota bacterium]